MNSQKSKESYLFVDHRASPGLSPEMARRMGYPAGSVSEGKLLEIATLTCCHCGTISIKNPERVRPRELCFKCNSYICDFCAARAYHSDYIHNPLAKLIDDIREAAIRNPNG